MINQNTNASAAGLRADVYLDANVSALRLMRGSIGGEQRHSQLFAGIAEVRFNVGLVAVQCRGDRRDLESMSVVQHQRLTLVLGHLAQQLRQPLLLFCGRQFLPQVTRVVVWQQLFHRGRRGRFQHVLQPKLKIVQIRVVFPIKRGQAGSWHHGRAGVMTMRLPCRT